MQVIEAMGATYSTVTQQAAVRAGDMQKNYRERGGRRERSIAYFIVGAQVLPHDARA